MSGGDLPKGWIKTTLEELINQNRPICYGVIQPGEDVLGGNTLIRICDLNNGSVDTEHLRCISQEVNQQYQRSCVDEGDVLVSIVGTIGRVSIVPGELKGSNIARALAKLSPNGAVTGTWLAYWLSVSEMQDWLVRESREVARKTLNLAELAQAPVPLAPLPEQHRIVEKIEALTARSRRAREALDALPSLIDRYRQSLLAAAFRGDLTAEWRNGRTDIDGAITLDAIRRVFRSRQRKAFALNSDWECPVSIPNGWACERLEFLCDPIRGIPYGIVLTGEPFIGGTPTVRCGDIKDYHIDLGRLKCVDPSIAANFSRTELRGGEVLLAIRGTVGATAVAGPDMAGMNISREVAMLPVLPGLDARYLSYLMMSPVGAKHLMQHIKGVAQSGINLSDLRNFPVLLPHIDEQSLIVKTLDIAFARLRYLTELVAEKAGQLSTLDQSILAKAFRGELVPQDPNDEPASVLLERIRAERAAAGGKTSGRRGRPRKAG